MAGFESNIVIVAQLGHRPHARAVEFYVSDSTILERVTCKQANKRKTLLTDLNLSTVLIGSHGKTCIYIPDLYFFFVFKKKNSCRFLVQKEEEFPSD